jgi:hypothetical protein
LVISNVRRERRNPVFQQTAQLPERACQWTLQALHFQNGMLMADAEAAVDEEADCIVSRSEVG